MAKFKIFMSLTLLRSLVVEAEDEDEVQSMDPVELWDRSEDSEDSDWGVIVDEVDKICE